MASQLPSKKRGRGVASSKAIDAPVLSISSTHGHGLALKSTRSVTNAPLNSGTTPSNEELTSRLAESFGASWNAFNDIFLRKGRARSDEEIWITGTQRRLNSLLNRLHSQEASKISTSLPLFIAYHPALHVSVAHEGGLPGFSSSFLAQYTSCTYNAGAFSPPFDAKEVAPQSQSHASARRRTTFKYLSDLIHELECQGTFVVAMYYNDENELCFYKTAEFDLCSTEDSGTFFNDLVIGLIVNTAADTIFLNFLVLFQVAKLGQLRKQPHNIMHLAQQKRCKPMRVALTLVTSHQDPMKFTFLVWPPFYLVGWRPRLQN